MSEIDLTGLPEDPEINLDAWIAERLPIDDAASFYADVLKIDPNHCRGDKEVWFMQGVQGAAMGVTDQLSLFLSHDDYFATLTKPKRELLAWVLNNPQSTRPKQFNTRNRMQYFAHMVAELTVWCGYGKTAAIHTIVDNYLNRPDADQSQEAADAREQRKESLRTQIFREIGKGGKVHDYYQRRVAEIQHRLEELDRLRAERKKSD